MGKAKRAGLFVLRKASLFFSVKALLTLFVLVYAATITATTTTYQASVGGLLTVSNNLKAVDKGFTKATSSISAAGTSCVANVTFTGSPGTANTVITNGNMVFSVQVNSTGSTVANTCFTVNLLITPSSGGQVNSTVYIATDASPANDETIDCKFDVTASLPASPYSFKVTVQ